MNIIDYIENKSKMILKQYIKIRKIPLQIYMYEPYFMNIGITKREESIIAFLLIYTVPTNLFEHYLY